MRLGNVDRRDILAGLWRMMTWIGRRARNWAAAILLAIRLRVRDYSRRLWAAGVDWL